MSDPIVRFISNHDKIVFDFWLVLRTEKQREIDVWTGLQVVVLLIRQRLRGSIPELVLVFLHHLGVDLDLGRSQGGCGNEFLRGKKIDVLD
jgi:hypothetical protein